jgi:DNA-binding transcriptional MocR family regulator
VVCPGAQSALTAVLTTIAKPGDRIIVEPLTYPGLIALAARLGCAWSPARSTTKVSCPRPWSGLCAEEQPAAVYLVPTTRNPGRHDHGPGATPRGRGRIIAEGGAWLIEDDPYSRLFDSPLPALAALAPERPSMSPPCPRPCRPACAPPSWRRRPGLWRNGSRTPCTPRP